MCFGFTELVLARRRAAEIVDRIDLHPLPVCFPCHLDLAFAIADEKPPRVLASKVTGTCSWVWPEIRVELLAQLRRAAMSDQPWATEALEDLDDRGRRSWIVRELVVRVATAMAADMRARGLEAAPRPIVLTFPRR